MPVILLGGIYSGYFTATEAAAVALVYALLVEIFMHKEMKPRDFYARGARPSKLGGSLFPVLAVALSLNIVLIEHRVPGQMVRVHAGLHQQPADVHAAGQRAAADRRLPDDHAARPS